MPVSEADTATVAMKALVDQGIPDTAPASEADPVPSFPVFLPVWPSPVTDWSETRAGSIKSDALTEHTQDDDEHGKTDGCLARTNTVTTCGKAEAAREVLDVAACFFRLQGELKKDEELEEEEEEEAEAEEVARQEAEKEEKRRRTVDKMWIEKQKRIRAVESTSSIDGRLQEFLHNPEVVGSIFGGISDSGESSAGPVLGDKLTTDAGTHAATPSGDEGVVTESSASESVREPTVPLKFEWGTGIAPGEERYSSGKSQGAFGCCVVS